MLDPRRPELKPLTCAFDGKVPPRVQDLPTESMNSRDSVHAFTIPFYFLVSDGNEPVLSVSISSEEPTRRDSAIVPAIEPKDGTLTCKVRISRERMQTVARRSLGHAKECGYTVPASLESPTAIFEGLRRDEDEDRWGFGWRCYRGVPDHGFLADR